MHRLWLPYMMKRFLSGIKALIVKPVGANFFKCSFLPDFFTCYDIYLQGGTFSVQTADDHFSLRSIEIKISSRLEISAVYLISFLFWNLHHWQYISALNKISIWSTVDITGNRVQKYLTKMFRYLLHWWLTSITSKVQQQMHTLRLGNVTFYAIKRLIYHAFSTYGSPFSSSRSQK